MAGMFATGRPSIAREFLRLMTTEAPVETKWMVDCDDVRMSHRAWNARVADGEVGSDDDRTSTRKFEGDSECSKFELLYRAGFTGISNLLGFSYCVRCVPPDREDVQLLALDMMREFVSATVPAEKTRAIFEELCGWFAGNDKWTMVRLISQNVLGSSSPFLLPVTVLARPERTARDAAIKWAAKYGKEVAANGTVTVKWMLDVIRSAFAR